MALIVTLDGPAGVGKSTLARRVAEELRIAYLDTGAMFRTIARELGEDGLALETKSLENRLEHLAFSLSGTGDATLLACNGRSAGQEIRSESIGYLASKFAALPPVRSFLLQAQRHLGRSVSLAAEGRDMGSVVFPEAPCKFFLDAAPEIRAKRRQLQLEAAGETVDFPELVKQIRRRDDLDRNRALAPLRPAPDAVIIDTGALDIQEVFQAIMRHIPSCLRPVAS